VADDVDIHLVLQRGAVGIPPSVADAVEGAGAAARPQFSGTSDPSLSTFWLVRVPHENAAGLVDSLRQLPDVDGAYITPPDEPA
jgi:hypothetical protein